MYTMYSAQCYHKYVIYISYSTEKFSTLYLSRVMYHAYTPHVKKSL